MTSYISTPERMATLAKWGKGYDPLGYLNQPSVAESQAMIDELSTPGYWDKIGKMKEESRERYGNQPSPGPYWHDAPGGRLPSGVTFGNATDDPISNNESIIRNSANKPRVTSQTFR